MLFYVCDQGIKDGIEGVDPVDMSPVSVEQVIHPASNAMAVTYFSLYSLITRFP